MKKWKIGEILLFKKKYQIDFSLQGNLNNIKKSQIFALYEDEEKLCLKFYCQKKKKKCLLPFKEIFLEILINFNLIKKIT